MTRAMRWLLLGLTGGGFIWGITRALSPRRQEAPPDMDNTPVVDVSAPPFAAAEVQPGMWLADAAAHAFLNMRAAAQAAGISLPLSTAWRSREWQQKLYDAWVAYQAGTGPWAPMAAKPGTSLHEKGIAIDVSGVNPAASNYNLARANWLKTNAARYGFYNTGAYFSSPEPWHYAFGVKREGASSLFA